MTRFDFPALCIDLQEMVLDRLEWKQRVELLSVNSSLRQHILKHGPFGDRIDQFKYRYVPPVCGCHPQKFEKRHRIKINGQTVPVALDQIRFLPLFHRVVSVREAYLDALPDYKEVPLVIAICHQLGTVADINLSGFRIVGYRVLFEIFMPGIRVTRQAELSLFESTQAAVVTLKSAFQLQLNAVQKFSIRYLNLDEASWWLDLFAITEAKTMLLGKKYTVMKAEAEAYLEYMFRRLPPSQDAEIGWHFEFEVISRSNQMSSCHFAKLLQTRRDLIDISNDEQLVDWLEGCMPKVIKRTLPLLYRRAYQKREPDDGGVQLFCLLTARTGKESHPCQLDFKWLPPPPLHDQTKD